VSREGSGAILSIASELCCPAAGGMRFNNLADWDELLPWARLATTAGALVRKFFSAQAAFR